MQCFLRESLPNAPCWTPSMLLLPQALQKHSEFKRFRPSITAILSSAACMDPDINLPLATFWHSLAEILEFTRLDVLKAAKSSFDGECSSNIWDRTYAISNWKSSWHEGCNLRRLFPWVRIATSCKQSPWELFRVNTLSMQCFLRESLPNAPCWTPSMLLLPQALQKDSEFKRFRPSITAILSSAACMDPDINLPLVTFWHSLAEILEFTRLDVLKAAKSSFGGEGSSNIWDRTYAISNWKSSWHEGCNLRRLFPWVRIATSCKQ